MRPLPMTSTPTFRTAPLLAGLAHRPGSARRAALAGAALLFAAAAAASTPLHAESAPILVPVGVQDAAQSASFDAQFAPFDTAPQPQADEAQPADEGTLEPIGTGTASWYGREFTGRRTASGEKFDPQDLTAAHRSLPFGSMVRVTNTKTGRSVVVRINDRGPFSRNRLIDVSRAAADQLGLIGPGSGQVSIALING